MITGVANAPGCDPNQPSLGSAGASASTSNTAVASSQTPVRSSSSSQNSSAINVRQNTLEVKQNTLSSSSQVSPSSIGSNPGGRLSQVSSSSAGHDPGGPSSQVSSSSLNLNSTVLSAQTSTYLGPGPSDSSASGSTSGNSGNEPVSSSSVGVGSNTSLRSASSNSRNSLPTVPNSSASSSLFQSSASASPGSSVSAGAYPSVTSSWSVTTLSTGLTSGLGSMFSPSASSAASAIGSPGCPGTPQCVLVSKGFDGQCRDSDWAYCYCSGSPAPLITSWMGNMVMPNCDYSTIPPSQCPGSLVIPYVPTASGASITEEDGRLVIQSNFKRAIPATSMSSASCAMTSEASTFTLTVSAILPCTGPTRTRPTSITSTSNAATSTVPEVVLVPCTSNATGNFVPPATPEQWQGWKVDEFWQSYYENTSHWQEKGLMPQFFQDFSGGFPGDGSNYVCSIDDETDCSYLQACSTIATGDQSWLLPYTTPAWFLWTAMTNFSKLLNMIWQTLEWAKPDMDLYAYEVGEKFEVELPGATKWSKIFPILNTILTLIAVSLIALNPLVDATLDASYARL